MKKVKINDYQIGLVFKNDVYLKMLVPGNYWLWLSEQVMVYDITKQFYPAANINILLQDAILANALQVVEVLDNEIVLQYENGIFKNVLTVGKYAFWKSIVQYDFIKANTANMEIDAAIDKNILANKLVIPFLRHYVVESYEKGLLFVDGKFVQVLESGIYQWWKNATAIIVVKADIRQQQLEINGQEILTKDKAALRINAWAQFQLENMEKALIENKDYEKQLYIILQLVLREYVSAFNFDELLEKKDNLANFIVENVQAKAAALGVLVNGFGIRDIILPGDMKDIMNQVLIAEKKAQANVIMRREETASTRSLLNTAKLMEDNAMLWKLKEMEYVEKIADKINNITVNGNGNLVEQLKQILVNK
jgi:regulator of protease activity HflC (stomatin/prohibitin superfamily)